MIYYKCYKCGIIYDKDNKVVSKEDIDKIDISVQTKYCKDCSKYKNWEMEKYGG